MSLHHWRPFGLTIEYFSAEQNPAISMSISYFLWYLRLFYWFIKSAFRIVFSSVNERLHRFVFAVQLMSISTSSHTSAHCNFYLSAPDTSTLTHSFTYHFYKNDYSLSLNSVAFCLRSIVTQ